MGERRRRAVWSLLPLLTATTTATMANTLVNVPMPQILAELHAPLSRGVLISTAFTVTLATLMPISGWLGDRLGQRRLLCAAMLTLAVGSVGAACAQSLPYLVAFRLVQGMSAAPVLPAVMVMVVRALGVERRGRALGLWAAANGAGQALGPTAGGVLAGTLGWRAVFWPVVPLCLLVAATSVVLLPHDRTADTGADRSRLDWRGAVLLTSGAGLLMAAIAAIPTLGVTAWPVGVAAVAAMAALAWFVHVEKGRDNAFLPPRHLLEVRYVRSAAAVTAQMFSLGAILLAVPVHLVQFRGLSTVTAGAVILALPLTMALLAPLAGWGCERLGGRLVMRLGLLALLIGLALLAVSVAQGGNPMPALLAGLITAGAGVACVQTPAATGASLSVAGQTGAGLGVFNLIRFGAVALGATCVALIGPQPHESIATLLVCAATAVTALALTFLGGDPSDILTGTTARPATPPPATSSSVTPSPARPLRGQPGPDNPAHLRRHG